MPAGGLLLAGGGAILGGALPALLGAGKSGYQAGNFGDSRQYNPGASNVGVDYNRQYGARGDQAQMRGAIQAQTGNVDAARTQANLARGEQAQALGLARARALGQTPSIADMQGQRMLGQALADQQSAVASARGGPGAQALAARGAMLAGANMRGNIAGQSAQAAAQERLAAEQAYLSGATGMRGQDLSGQGLDQQFALGQGQLALGSRGQNDQYQLGLYGLQNQAAIAEAQGRVAQQGQLAGSMGQANATNAQTAGNNAQQDWNYIKGGVGGAMGGLQAGSMLGGAGRGTPGTNPQPGQTDFGF